MTKLDRYIAFTVVSGVVIGLGGLLAIFSVINLTHELQDVGIGHYRLPVALWFVAMSLPSEAYELFPAAALIGSSAALALLAGNNELVAIFAAGVAPRRVVLAVLEAAFGLAVIAALLGELVAAPLMERATEVRSISLSSGQSLGTGRGIWAREGSRFINIRRPAADGTLNDVYFFDFDSNNQLEQVTHAQQAQFHPDGWQLEDVSLDVIGENDIVRKNLPTEPWLTFLTPDQLHLLTVPPENLSLADLRRSVSSMQQRGESAQHHLLAFWRRATMPIIAAIMVFLAVPIVLSTGPRVPFGYRVAFAALLGIGFQMLNETFGSFGLVYGFNAFFSATAPAIIALALGIWRLRDAV